MARIAGSETARVASAQEVEQATGFAPGAVAPFPLPHVDTVLLERTLLRHPLVWAGAGRRGIWSASPPPSSADSLAHAPLTSSRTTICLEIRLKKREADSMQETDKIWMNGDLVDWADAKVHVGAHGLHYGSGVFEGIRCYETEKGPAVFRLQDHLQRLEHSAKVLYMDLPYSTADLRAATHELVAANGLPTCYVRPIAFYGYGELGVATTGNPVDIVIMSFPWGAYLGEDGQQAGISTMISSWERVGPNVIPHVAKATGIYLNSMLATTEARRAGYDEAIMLTRDGYVADGPGENIFVVKDGRLLTPPLSMSILPGSPVTRSSTSHGHSATPSRRRCSSAPISTSPTRRSWSAPRPRSRPSAPSTVTRSVSGRSRSSCRRRTSTSSGAEISAGATGSTWSRRRARRPKCEATRQVSLSSPWLDEREEELVARRAALGTPFARPRRSTASRRHSPRLSAHRTQLPSRAAPRVCTFSASPRESAPATRSSPRPIRSSRPRTARSTRVRRRCSPTSTRAR